MMIENQKDLRNCSVSGTFFGACRFSHTSTSSPPRPDSCIPQGLIEYLVVTWRNMIRWEEDALIDSFHDNTDTGRRRERPTNSARARARGGGV